LAKIAGDTGRGIDAVAVKEFKEILDRGRMRTEWRCDKFWDRQNRLYRELRAGASVLAIARKYPGSLYATIRVPHNLLLNEGINLLWTLGCGGSGTPWNNANAYIGVGDSSTAAAATQTGLQATTNKLYKAMDSGYPIYGSSQYSTWRSTFGTGDANWAWNEYTVCNSNSDSGVNLNRLVQSLGTKTSSFSWVLSLQITLA
jgi:hypothetical protein